MFEDFYLDDPTDAAMPHIRSVIEMVQGYHAEQFTIASSLLDQPLSDGNVVPFIWNRYLDGGEKEALVSRNPNPTFDKNSARNHVKLEKEVLIPFVTEYLQQDRRYVVFQDPVLEAYMPSPEGPQHRFFTHGQVLYFYLPPFEKNHERDERILRAPHWPILGIFTSLPTDLPRLRDGQSFSDDTVPRILAQRMTHIIVEAFDSCGFLLWSKSD